MRYQVKALLIGLLSLVAVAIHSTAVGQDMKSSADALYVFERIATVDMKKAEIVAHVNAFIAERFVSGKSVIQLSDPELGRVVGDVVLMNSKAGVFDAFKGIKTRIVVDAKDGRFRLQASNVEGINGKGVVPPVWGKLESANRYRIEPLAQSLLPPFADEFHEYLKKAKAKADF